MTVLSNILIVRFEDLLRERTPGTENSSAVRNKIPKNSLLDLNILIENMVLDFLQPKEDDNFRYPIWGQFPPSLT